MVSVRLACLMICVCSVASGQALSQETEPGPFTLKPGQVDQDGEPVSGASACVTRHLSLCYEMPPHDAPGSSVVYQFGLDPHLKLLSESQQEVWGLFSSTFSAGGSGSLERFAILRYTPGSSAHSPQIQNLLPYVALTNVSDHQVWLLPNVSPESVLVTADFVWGPGETHFSSHFYTVQAWVFDPATGAYRQALSYQTRTKYDGGDAAPVQVLSSEKPAILAALQHRKR